MVLPNIEAERIKHQMSKAELAQMLGVSKRTIQNWQNGSTEVPLSKLLCLANAWNLSTDYLLGLTDSTDATTHDSA